MAVLAAAAARDPLMIVDLAALEFIGCCALGRVRAQARQAGGDLLLAAPRGQARRILTLTVLIDVASSTPAWRRPCGPPDAPAWW
jgi:anti-anti-sigma factor